MSKPDPERAQKDMDSTESVYIPLEKQYGYHTYLPGIHVQISNLKKNIPLKS